MSAAESEAEMAETVQRVAQFPYFEVEFGKRGEVLEPGQAAALTAFLQTGAGDGRTTDLLVLSHGWNNDEAEARTLYRRLLTRLRAQFPAVPTLAGRRFAVLAIFWPSKRFADRELIPGGAAGRGAPAADEVSAAALAGQLDDLAGAFDAADADRRLEQAKALVDRLETDAAAQRRFVDLLRPLFPEPDEETAAELPDELFDLPGDEVLERLTLDEDEEEVFEGGAAAISAGPGRVAEPTGGAAAIGGAAAGGAAGLGGFFDRVRNGGRNFLNLLTYYQMKERAGTVGIGGLYDTLREVRRVRPEIRLHLVGHSFGGRVVTAAAAGPPFGPPLGVDSLTLVQAAFSHYGFAADWDRRGSDGFFRAVVTDPRVRGPLLVTHTINDRAVGLAYPLASRLAGQVAAALGDEHDVYGGLGRNGALATPEARAGRLLAAGGAYAFTGGAVFNLRGDEFIAGHSAITGPEVAYALACAIAAT